MPRAYRQHLRIGLALELLKNWPDHEVLELRDEVETRVAGVRGPNGAMEQLWHRGHRTRTDLSSGAIHLRTFVSQWAMAKGRGDCHITAAIMSGGAATVHAQDAGHVVHVLERHEGH